MTVLSEKASDNLNLQYHFNRFMQIENIAVSVSDTEGNILKTYTRKNFDEQAAFDGISLVTDYKVLKLNVTAPKYPCTVNIALKYAASGYIELPDGIIDCRNALVENFKYTVKVAPETDIRYRMRGVDQQPVISSEAGKRVYQWNISNVQPMLGVKNSYRSAQLLPAIEVAPNVFSYDGYAGSFRSWQDFGKWNYPLYNDGKGFSASRVSEIKQLLNDVTDEKQKINILYEYLQKNLRYVSIQLGIGGFKPFSVKFVDENKYGDCKALTNYMRNMLAIAGIRSYPALVNAGYDDKPADESFPSDPFNHVILCVPLAKDSVWLECTSNTLPLGFLGQFTEDKKALLLTESGGVLVNTPKSDYRRNSLRSSWKIDINENGSAKTTAVVHADGNPADIFESIADETEEDRNEYLLRTLAVRRTGVAGKFQISLSDKHIMNIAGDYEKYYDFISGKKFFIPIKPAKLYNESQVSLAIGNDYILKYPYTKTDTVVYQLSPTLTVERSPNDVEVTNSNMEYKRRTVYDKEKNTLQIITELRLKNKIIPFGQQITFAGALKEVYAQENEKIILVRKD
jgi:hypothetical protein